MAQPIIDDESELDLVMSIQIPKFGTKLHTSINLEVVTDGIWVVWFDIQTLATQRVPTENMKSYITNLRVSHQRCPFLGNSLASFLWKIEKWVFLAISRVTLLWSYLDLLHGKWAQW